MSTSTLFPRTPLFPLLAAAMIVGTACAGRTPVPSVAAGNQTAPAAVATPVTPASSVFDIADFWYSQHVPAAKLSSLSGGLLVVGFVGDTCDSACGTTLASMKLIERETDVDVHFVLVSRTAQGTPASLASFAKARHLSAGRYTLISSSDETIAKLVASLDRRNGSLTAESLQASSTLSVLDYNGVVVHQRGDGVVGPLLEALTLLSNIR